MAPAATFYAGRRGTASMKPPGEREEEMRKR
jgi:hypothetical protein